MAQLSGESWRQFQIVNNLYEKAELKGQKAKATDIVNKGKPVLKQWQLKCLCRLSPQDQTLLLEKVNAHFCTYCRWMVLHIRGQYFEIMI